jgi:hypothetical protein
MKKLLMRRQLIDYHFETIETVAMSGGEGPYLLRLINICLVVIATLTEGMTDESGGGRRDGAR